jgi:transcriptional regulator with XRE-family HTH domain
MTPIERLARKLRTLRHARRLTQEQLAAKAGLSREYLARLETARQDPSLSTLKKLAKALRVTAAALLR